MLKRLSEKRRMTKHVFVSMILLVCLLFLNNKYAIADDSSTSLNTKEFSKTSITTTGSQVVNLTGISLRLQSGRISIKGTTNASYSLIPNNAKNVIIQGFSSSNTGVARVDSRGVISGVSGGKATITITAKQGTIEKKGTATIYVDCENSSHKWGAWVIEEEATYQYDGARHRTCSVCQKFVQEKIPKLTTQKPTTTTCSHPKASLTNMNYKSIHSAQHTYEVICSKCNKKISTITENHVFSFQSNSTEHWQKCSACGYEGAKSNHTFGIWLPDNVAGRSYRECSVCKYREITYASAPKNTGSPKVKATITIPSQLTYGQSSKVVVTISPSDASNINITYASEDETIARVVSTGAIIGMKKGSTRITVIVKQGDTTITSVTKNIEIIETKTSHEYVPAEEWTKTSDYHYRACIYPNCGMTLHRIPTNLSTYGKHKITTDCIDPNNYSNSALLETDEIRPLIASFDIKRNNHIIVSMCSECDYLKARLEPHEYHATGENEEIHECSKCPASHKVDGKFSGPYTEPANCQHGERTYKICNVCGIEFDEHISGGADSTKHVITGSGYTSSPSGFEGEARYSEIYGNNFVFGHHTITGTCSVCGVNNVTVDESCERYLSDGNYYTGELRGYAKGSNNFYYLNNPDIKAPNSGHFRVLRCNKCGGPGRKEHTDNHDDTSRGESFLNGNYAMLPLTDTERDVKHQATCSACGWVGKTNHVFKSLGEINKTSNATNMNAPQEYNDRIIEHRPNKNNNFFKNKHYSFSYCTQCGQDVYGENDHVYSEVPAAVHQYGKKSALSTNNLVSHLVIYECGQCNIRKLVSGFCERLTEDRTEGIIGSTHVYKLSCSVCNVRNREVKKVLDFWLSFIAACGHQPAQYYWENLLDDDVSNFDFEQ